MGPDFSKTSTSCTSKTNHRFHHFLVPSLSLWFPLPTHPGRNQTLAVSMSWAAAFLFPFLPSQRRGSFSEHLPGQSSPLGPRAHSLATKLHLPPAHSLCIGYSYSLGNGQENHCCSLRRELIQNGITWSKRCSLLTYASSVWSSSLAMLKSFWGSVHWKKKVTNDRIHLHLHI